MGWQSDARAAARQVGIDPALYVALIRQESGGRMVTSPAGARGPAQLMPATARGLGVDPNNYSQNLLGGAKYLKQQLRAFGGDPRKALAAYNAGPGAVQRYGGIPPFRETQDYVKRIMSAVGSSGRGAGSVAAVRDAAAAQAPGAPSLDLGAASGAGAAALAALVSQAPRSRPSGSALPAPSFAARPVMAGALPDGSGAPAPRADIGALIAAARTVGQSVGPGAVSGPVAPAAPSPGGQAPLAMPKSGRNPWGVLDQPGRSGLYLQKRFRIETIGGYRANDPYPDHPSRKALDLMVGNDTRKGSAIARELTRNYKQHGVRYLIWNQRIWRPGVGWKSMADRGSPTQNHKDHVHVLYR